MGIRITGKKYLDNGNYKSVIFSEEDNDYNIQVNGCEYNEKEHINNHFYDNLDCYTDDEKMLEVLRLCLENNNLIYYSDNRKIVWQQGTYALVGGDRRIGLSSTNYKLRNAFSMMYTKYSHDRLSFLEKEQNIDRIEINTNFYSTYNKRKDIFGDYLELNIFITNHIVNPLEENFLEKFIYNKLKQKGEEATLENKNLFNEDSEDYINLGYDLTCGDLYISINSTELLPAVIKGYNKYNSEKRNNKKIQIEKENN